MELGILVGSLLTLVWALVVLISLNDAAKNTRRTALATERLVALAEWQAQQRGPGR